MHTIPYNTNGSITLHVDNLALKCIGVVRIHIECFMSDFCSAPMFVFCNKLFFPLSYSCLFYFLRCLPFVPPNIRLGLFPVDSLRVEVYLLLLALFFFCTIIHIIHITSFPRLIWLIIALYTIQGASWYVFFFFSVAYQLLLLSSVSFSSLLHVNLIVKHAYTAY